MKKIISTINGLGLLSTTISSTVACSGETTYTIEYKSSSGIENTEVSNIYFNSDNVPLIFIAFVAPDQQKKFLIIQNKVNDSSAEKIRKFYDTNATDQTYNDSIIISDIKYSYISEECIINNVHIIADIVTNIDFIK